MGFVLSPGEAEQLIAKSERNRDVILPFLNGAEFNSTPDQSGSRWVIFFRNWPLDKAERYPDCLQVVRERVKPHRDRNPRKFRRDHWWLFGEPTPGLYGSISGLSRVLARSRVANLNSIAFAPAKQVFSEAMVVFASDACSDFAILQAAPHTVWLTQYASSMRTDVRYTPSDCYETYPFPARSEGLTQIGGLYHEHRRQIMLDRQEGLTKTYNRFHDSSETAADIQKLRELHVEMDNAVAAAYGWTDLDLGHSFHETKQGIRYTISEPARREVLQRLLKLNHERYEEEVRQGLHEKKRGGKRVAGGGKKKRAKRNPEGPTLF